MEKRPTSKAVGKRSSVPSRDSSRATGELERVLVELQEANARLVIAGLQMQELSEHAETRRLQAEAAAEALFVEHERAEVTLNSIGDAVLCTDSGGHVTYLNAVAESMTAGRGTTLWAGRLPTSSTSWTATAANPHRIRWRVARAPWWDGRRTTS